MLALLDPRWCASPSPAIVALGPLRVAQHLFWARRRGDGRTTWQAEPRRGTNPHDRCEICDQQLWGDHGDEWIATKQSRLHALHRTDAAGWVDAD